MPSKGWLVLMAILLALASPGTARAQKPQLQFLDKDALYNMLGNPKVLILDVSIPRGAGGPAKRIPGAVTQDPRQAGVWGKTLPRTKKIVLYCA
jgi:hypothetical protein